MLPKSKRGTAQPAQGALRHSPKGKRVPLEVEERDRQRAREEQARIDREARLNRARKLSLARERAAMSYELLARRSVESAQKQLSNISADSPGAIGKVFEKSGDTFSTGALNYAKASLRMRQARRTLRGTGTAFVDRSPELSRLAMETTDQAAGAYETAAGKYEEADAPTAAAQAWDKAADLRIEIAKQLAKLDG